MERYHSSCFLRGAVSHHFQAVHGLASLIPLLVDFSLMTDLHLQPGGKGIYYRSAHSVKTSGYLVSASAEFSPCMEHRKDHFHRRDSGFMIDPYRNTSSVIYHRDGIVFIHRYLYGITEPGQRFIYRIVHDLVNQVMKTSG